MKYLKMACLFLLAGLFLLTSCAGLQSTSKRQLHEPEAFKENKNLPINFYVKHDCWKSPFNPHEVLQYWVRLGAQQLNPVMAITIVGNPKINWRQLRGTNPMGVAIPPGEITTAVVFVFAKTRMGTIELVSYGYKDNLGIKRIFMLDVETKCYERKLIPKQQSSCLSGDINLVFN